MWKKERAIMKKIRNYFAIFIITVFAAVSFTGCGGASKKDVKKQCFDFLPDITIGELLDNTHKDAYRESTAPPLWGEEDDKIEFDGENIYDGTKLFITFSEVTDDGFKIDSFHIGSVDAETSEDEFKEYILKCYKQYKGEESEGNDNNADKDEQESDSEKSETKTTTAAKTTKAPDQISLDTPVVSDFVNVTVPGGNGVTIRAEWEPVENAYGYEMQIVTTSTFDGSSSNLEITYDTFYETGGSMPFGVSLRVRAFMEMNGQKVYSDWSNEVSVDDIHDAPMADYDDEAYPIEFIGMSVYDMIDILGEPDMIENGYMGMGGNDKAYIYNNGDCALITLLSYVDTSDTFDPSTHINYIMVNDGALNEYIETGMTYNEIDQYYSLSELSYMDIDGAYSATAEFMYNGLNCVLLVSNYDGNKNSPFDSLLLFCPSIQN